MDGHPRGKLEEVRPHDEAEAARRVRYVAEDVVVEEMQSINHPDHLG